ncbi:MAG TPA: hypothetical protein VMZ69_00025 [Saprospiraceae bacterium]|nr:hypothetical protein [Saprospiraceae bacterium]
MNKQEVLQRIRESLENNVRELSNTLESQRSASDIDGGDTRDPEDFSQQSESRDKEMAFQIQLDAAQAQLGKLDDFTGKKITGAEPGAIVETDKNLFYLGISVSPMHIGNKELYGVSPDTPAYNAIRGKAKGDTFNVGKHEHTILDIY